MVEDKILKSDFEFLTSIEDVEEDISEQDIPAEDETEPITISFEYINNKYTVKDSKFYVQTKLRRRVKRLNWLKEQ